MIALVRGVMARSISAGSRFSVSGSMSTKTGFAPSSAIISPVAMNVNGVVITSSPGRMSSAIMAMSKASVPLETVRQWLTPTYSDSFFSSSPISGPMM